MGRASARALATRIRLASEPERKDRSWNKGILMRSVFIDGRLEGEPGRVVLYRRKGLFTVAPKDLEKIYFNYSAIDRVGFIRKQPITSHGILYKVRKERNLISDGDIVYLAPAEGKKMIPGQRYTTFRTLPPL